MVWLSRSGGGKGPEKGPEKAGVPGRAGGRSWPEWWSSPDGRYLAEWERDGFAAAVTDVFGYYAVQVGFPQVDALSANRMPHHIQVLTAPDDLRTSALRSVAAPSSFQVVGAQEPRLRPPPMRVHARLEELPFEHESLDLIVLVHQLEFSPDPHRVLRECERVLRPEGRVVVSGFNPASLWGARQALGRGILAPFLPQQGQFIPVPRLRDWMKLLSFEMDTGRYGCYAPSARTERSHLRPGFMDKAGDRWWPILGAAYLLSAVKRQRGMRLVGTRWRQTRHVVSAPGVAVGSGRSMGQGVPRDVVVPIGQSTAGRGATGAASALRPPRSSVPPGGAVVLPLRRR